MTLCECGCGGEVNIYRGKPKRFINGHQQRCPSDETRKKRSDIRKGYKHSEETKRKIGKGNKGKKCTLEQRKRMSEATKGQICSKETRKKLSLANKGQKRSDEFKRNLSKAMMGKNKGERSAWFGKKHSKETLVKMSKANGGKNNGSWKGGYSLEPYCQKFTYKLKEKIREKYSRRCFLCGKTEKENHRKLDVHHIDYNKNQGCNEHEWKLVPVCISCHGITGGDRKHWETLILDVLKFAWNE